MPKHFLPTLLEQQKRKLKLNLIHTFIFSMFDKLIKPSFTWTGVEVLIQILGVPMVAADQLEERALLCFEQPDIFKNCSKCTTPSGIEPKQQSVPKNLSSSY